ncbi:MAG: sigma-54 dependent transcriptional regulator [Gammaproteobacteria bacterium]|nr:sigma-54 dependent transcriptional regulator [Gammaproteobacteria bacterium]
MKPVILVDDDDDLRRAVKQTLELEGFEVNGFNSGKPALHTLKRDWQGVVVTDIRMPGMDGLALMAKIKDIDADIPVVLITGHGDVSTAVKAIQDGAYDFIEKPFRNAALLEVLNRAVEKRGLVLENRRLRSELAAQHGESLIGHSNPILRLKEKIASIAPAQVDVLITGETGTGKELVARAVHQQSPRRSGPFVAVNCAAIPETMVESELFGFEAGSFTGAHKRRVGRFESADGGTIFLDEIESIPPPLAAKILRVLQERSLERLGSNSTISLDIRIVAASKVDLKELSERGEFREDLYYRLNVVELCLPPLRERQEDIPLLFEHFVQGAVNRFERSAPEITHEIIEQLLVHSWPGNVRELKNAAERFVLGNELGDLDLLPPEAEDGGSGELNLPQRVEHFEKLLIEHALARHQGNVQKTYRALGIPRKTFYDKLGKYAINQDKFR